MDTITKTLTAFGLSDKEALVYREAVKYESTNPFALAKATKIPRTTVYEIITNLSLKGLVELERSDGITKQQTKIKAKNPSVLRKIIWDRRKSLFHLESDILNILPDLKSDYHKTAGANADFHFYPGIEGAKKVYVATDSDNTDIPQVGWDYQTPMDAFGRDFINVDVQKMNRTKMKLKCTPRELFPLSDWSRHVISYQYGHNPDYIKAIHYRYIENPIWDIKQRIIVKGSYTRIICIEEDESWGLEIASSSLAKSLFSLFEFMWQLGTPVSDEVVKSWGENEFLKAEREQKK